MKRLLFVLLLAITSLGYGGMCNKSGGGGDTSSGSSGSAPAIAAPSNLQATLTTYSGLPAVKFTWQDNSNNEDNFAVSIKPLGGGYIEDAVVAGANETIAYVDTLTLDAISSGTKTWYFKVRALSITVEPYLSSYSNEVSITLP